MLGVRKESVELSLADSGFSSGMAKDAALTALLNKELDKLDKTSVSASRSTTNLEKSVKNSGDSARRASSDLNQYTGRLSLLATAAATIGPALLPISATAIPAITGLTAGLGAAAGAAGVAVLAFHGIGDTLKALDAYELNPTTANLNKLNQALADLSPQAKEFVYQLDAMEPALQRLRATAAGGVLPGLTQGLDHLLVLGPEVRQVVKNIADELGGLGAEGGLHIANDADIQKFIAMIRQDAAPTLDAFAKATGNVIVSIGNLLVAFRPLDDAFDQRLLSSSQRFREWTANLENNQSFEHFVEFVQKEGPQVREFFHATGEALIGLAHAAAPWGATVLPLLTDVATVFATLAKSPVGPVIYDAAAAFVVLNLASSKFGLGTSAITGMRGAFAGLKGDLKATAGLYSAATTSSERFTLAGQAGGSMLSRLGGAVRGAAGIGGMLAFADSTNHAGTSLGTLESTIGGAATGLAIGGPWGAAVGGAIGLITSFGKSNHDASVSVQELTQSLDQQTGAFTANTAQSIIGTFDQGTLDRLKNIGVSIGDIVTATEAGGKQLDDLNDKIAHALAPKVPGSTAGNSNTLLEQFYGPNITGPIEHLRALSAGLVSAKQQHDSLAKAAAAAGNQELTMAQKVQIASAKLAAEKQAAVQASEGFFSVASALNEAGGKAGAAAASIDGLIARMRQQAKDITDFGHNLANAAKLGIDQGLLLQIEQLGAAGAPIMAQFAHASKKQVDDLNAAFRSGASATQVLDNAINGLKPKADLSQPIGQLAQFSGWLSGLNGLINTVNGQTVSPKLNLPSSKPPVLHQASGGRIVGPGTGTSDSIPALVSNGEYIVKAAAVAKYGPTFFDHLNAMRFSGGGAVNPNSAAAAYGITITPGESIPAKITAFTHALDRATNSLQNEVQARDSLISTVKGNLTGSLFGQASSGSSVFSSQFASGSLGDVNAQLRQQTNDARLQTKLEKDLRHRGVSGAALQDLITNGGLPALKQFAAGSNADLATYQHLYQLRGSAVNDAANTAAGVLGLNAGVATMNAQLVAIKNEIEQLKADERSAHKATAAHRKTAATKYGQATAKALDATSKKSRQF